MSAGAPQPLLDAENELGVLERRFARLRAAGYPESDAAELAARLDIDLHLAELLLGRGCPLELALRILR